MVTRAAAKKILLTYGRAWTTQSVPLILSIFTKDAQYHERVFAPPFRGHRGITKYWQEKVVEDQSNIRFKLLRLWPLKDTIIAEWEASFYSKEKQKRKRIREVGIMKLEGGRIKELREYWGHKRRA